MLVFIPVLPHAAQNLLSACWIESPYWEDASAVPNRPQKAHGWTCYFQLLHSRRLDYDGLIQWFSKFFTYSPLQTQTLSILPRQKTQKDTLQTRYNADVGIHNIRPRCKWVALYRDILLRNKWYTRYSHDQVRIFPWQCDVYTKNETRVDYFSACLFFFLAISHISFKCRTWILSHVLTL